MNFYIATGLEMVEAHNRVRDDLVSRGHAITYDWTKHGSVQADGDVRCAETATLELNGVRDADVVVVLLPGGRGTHTELGCALALGKPVVMVARPVSMAFSPGIRTSVFYYCSTITREYISAWDDADEIKHVGDVVERKHKWRSK